MAGNQHTSPHCARARETGEKHYWTGSPCRHGHIAMRYTVDQSCVECKRLATEARKQRAKCDPELAEAMRGWHRKAKAKARSTVDGKRAHYEANKRYTEGNRDKVSSYYRKRRRDDPVFNMACWMRSTLHKVLGRANRRKDARCVEMLGYDRDQLKAHIEAQFLKGMGWHNRAEWEIDHIIPVAEMLRRGETNPAVINALSNLRPMWAGANRAKGDKVLTLV